MWWWGGYKCFPPKYYRWDLHVIYNSVSARSSATPLLATHTYLPWSFLLALNDNKLCTLLLNWWSDLWVILDLSVTFIVLLLFIRYHSIVDEGYEWTEHSQETIVCSLTNWLSGGWVRNLGASRKIISGR